MDQILIKDLLVRGIIGVNADERENPQDILLNITVFTDTRPAGLSDNIIDTISYSMLAKKIRHHTEKIQRFTLEAFAEDIARLILEEKRVEKVRVRVEKPHVVRFTASVGVEIERTNY
jgi:FolB domain-containing protein